MMMSPEKSILIDQINAIIESGISGMNHFPAEPVSRVPQAAADALPADTIPLGKLLQSNAQLEQRVLALEKVNEQLLYFIHFLFDNFSKLTAAMPESSAWTGPSASRNEPGPKDMMEKPGITRREAEVLQLLTRGLCVKEIAAELFISENTVITHKKNLKEKFQARNTVDLVTRAYKKA